jgi:hypothetical protein
MVPPPPATAELSLSDVTTRMAEPDDAASAACGQSNGIVHLFLLALLALFWYKKEYDLYP